GQTQEVSPSPISPGDPKYYLMNRSPDPFPPPHAGSPTRPEPLLESRRLRQARQPFDGAAYEKCLSACVADIVRHQAEVGVDVVSDGEFGKSISWSQYGLERLSGFERRRVHDEADPLAPR